MNPHFLLCTLHQKTTIVAEEYNAFVGEQTHEVVTCLFEDMKEVNLYELWGAKIEMDLKDIVYGLHSDLANDVWYGKEDLYGITEFITTSLDLTR